MASRKSVKRTPAKDSNLASKTPKTKKVARKRQSSHGKTYVSLGSPVHTSREASLESLTSNPHFESPVLLSSPFDSFQYGSLHIEGNRARQEEDVGTTKASIVVPSAGTLFFPFHQRERLVFRHQLPDSGKEDTLSSQFAPKHYFFIYASFDDSQGYLQIPIPSVKNFYGVLSANFTENLEADCFFVLENKENNDVVHKVYFGHDPALMEAFRRGIMHLGVCLFAPRSEVNIMRSC